MSSYDKVVKLACKPKAAPPKPKYLDTILAATWSEDGAVHDVCKALSPRFREPNAIVVFKALIVLHTMIRNGATDNVLSYLSSSEVLRLKNVSAGNWEGYNTPQNLQHYAIYLDSRIRAYRDLKHDAVRVQAESNRDMRNNNSIEEDMAYRTEKPGPKAPTRSKTIMGRKLRVMTVEKGLLRETKAVQRMIDALVECRFYLDDLGDELTITAFRMLVKDLLILFQAGNEGVINVLEHYFEMSHPDAEQALAIYRQFCKQAERVVEFLTVAKKLQNLLNVPVPNLKHAPVSLAGALEEYLNDPNFEQNRIEYRANKLAADKATQGTANSTQGISGSANGSVSSKGASKVSFAEQKKPERSASTSQPTRSSKPDTNQAMQDFFAAIEEEQPTIFNPETGSPNAQFQQSAGHNPFGAFGFQPTSLQPQPTGYVMPQMTAFQPMTQPNPFGLQLPQQQQEHRPFSSFMPSQMQSQPIGFLQPQATAFLQPLHAQTTGSNPFRQSMMMPQTTGFPASPFGQQQHELRQDQSSSFSPPAINTNQGQGGSSPFSTSPFPQASAFNPSISPLPSALSTQPIATSTSDLPARPASTPLTSFGASSSASTAISPPEAQPIKTHQTGSRNPFGVPTTTAPPVPKAPTLMELYMNGGSLNSQTAQQNSQSASSLGGINEFGALNAEAGKDKTDMASVASSFSLNKLGNKKTSLAGTFPFLGAQDTATTMTTASGSGFSDPIFSALSGQPTGVAVASGGASPSISLSSTLKPQMTGFSGLKAFKPSSSFGTSLLESLPPIPNSNPSILGTDTLAASTSTSVGLGVGLFKGATPFSSQPTGPGPQPTTASSFGALSAGSSLGVGLRPQMTGGGANPFRASMFTNSSTGAPASGSTGGAPPSTVPSSSFSGAAGLNGSPFNAFGGGAFGSLNPNGIAQDSSKDQQNGSASLI